jgi:hypothetical protein
MTRRYPAPPSPRARALRAIAFALPIAVLMIAIVEYIEEVLR